MILTQGTQYGSYGFMAVLLAAQAPLFPKTLLLGIKSRSARLLKREVKQSPKKRVRC